MFLVFFVGYVCFWGGCVFLVCFFGVFFVYFFFFTSVYFGNDLGKDLHHYQNLLPSLIRIIILEGVGQNKNSPQIINAF